MPSKYNFLQLSPSEFQFLCRDLLQQHISKELGIPFVFNSFREGRDQGKDAFFQDTERKIILQCKRYVNFSDFYHELKNIELEKIKRISPCRYILATSLDLSEKELDKVFQLLSPYLVSSSDIVGQKMLNNLLDLYPDIKLNYPQLYLDSADILNRILHSDIYHRSKSKLNEFNNISKYYVSSPSFIQAHNTLKEHHYVIISGDPGVGKSTMAGMLCLDYIQRDYEFVFVLRSISEASHLWQDGKKQIFFFDDFLGTPFFQELGRNENRELFDFIKDIRRATDKLLIITTREYVFRQAENEYPEFKELNYTKCLIAQNHFSKTFRIHILYNYLYYSSIEYKHIECLVKYRNYEEIIFHPHFTPRLLNDYIDRKYDRTGSSYSFYWGLKEYLDDPYEYWKTVFKGLSLKAQMLLLSITVTEEPIFDKVIFETFKRINQYRKMFDEGYETDNYEAALAELSESFITVSCNPDIKDDENSNRTLTLILTCFHNARYIEFQNPSIKDFTIYYLRKREDLIEILLKSAFTFNQLFYIFTTSEKDVKIEDSSTTHYLQVEKIHLSIPLQEVIIDKILEEFDKLPIVQATKRHWSDEVTTFHVNETNWDNEMEKLYQLTVYFDLQYVPVLKDFIIEKYQEIIRTRKEQAGQEDFSDYYPYYKTHCYLNLEERVSQVKVIKAIFPYVSFDAFETIKDYYMHIKYAKEYIALYELGQLFPEAFKEVIISDMKNIRKRLKDLIWDDVQECCWKGSSDSLNLLHELIEEDLYTLAELYHFRITTKFLKSLNEVAGMDLFDLEDDDEEEEEDENREIVHAVSSEMNDYISYQEYQTLLHQLIPDWDFFSNPQEASNYIGCCLKSKKLDSKWRNNIIRFANKNDSDLLFHPVSVDLLISYYEEHLQSRKSLRSFWEYCLHHDSLSEHFLASLKELAFQLFESETYIFRKETISLLHLSEGTIEHLESLLESRFFFRTDIWFRFFSQDFHIYLAAKHISELPEAEKLTFYQKFITDYLCIEYSRWFFTYCYEIDRQFVLQSVVLPYLQKELDSFCSSTLQATVVAYLRKNEIGYDFEFNEDEKIFDCTGGSGGNSLTEDLIEILSLKTNEPYWDLENCFNISLCECKALKEYLKEHFAVHSKKYTIDLVKEIEKPGFYPALEAAKIPQLIVRYANCLKDFIYKYQR